MSILELSHHIIAQPARLPAIYERAKATLAECIRIDECKDWADRAEALASYARQAKDDELRWMADRIQARAIRRAGELLKEIAPASGRPPENGRATSRISRAQAAHQAGLSEHQRKTALRVATVRRDEFERAIAGVAPPTITELARRGTKSASRNLRDLGSCTEQEFNPARALIDGLNCFAKHISDIDPKLAIREADEDGRQKIRPLISGIGKYLEGLKSELENNRCT